MAGSKSDYLEGVVLNLVLGATAYTAPTNVYIALSTAAYSDAATGSSITASEPSGNAYTRLLVANSSANWPAATGTSPTQKANGAAFTFTTATGSWGTIASFYIVDNSVNGNVLYGGDLTASKAIASGDTATFAASTGIIVTED